VNRSTIPAGIVSEEDFMRLPLRARLLRGLTAVGLIATLLVPAAVPVAAQEETVLRVGTGQDLDSMNPWQTALVVGFEVFTLNYDLLVNFGPDLEPVPGFAESWEQSEDGLTWTFKMRDGMLWSDGTPATAEDAAWTLQFALDGTNSEAGVVGLGYIDYYLTDAGVTAVEATDPTTLVVTTDRPNDQILKTYIPILPKHVWESQTLESVNTFTNPVPIVGSGPYQAVEWQTGQFIRFQKNPNYWKEFDGPEQVVIQIFESGDTASQALQNGELDYYTGLNAQQFDAITGTENITTVSGTANGFTELGFNTYGTDIEGGGASTTALRDPAFRDALGYAIDKDLLVTRVLGGYGDVGTTQLPPFQVKWHADPTTARTFDLELAKQKLLDAGYQLDADGKRLDAEGNPINLRLYMPDSDETYPVAGEFIADWFGDLGINVTPQIFDSATLTNLMLPPEAGDPANKADYDMFIWGWAGDVDPNSLLKIFKCDQIGSSSDSNYCNPRYDELFEQQNTATSEADRLAAITEMQQIMYDEAPYHILYYDSSLDAYRTDHFEGWANQPTANGVPLFGYGSLGYTLLHPAGAAAPSASAGASGEPAAPGESAAPTPSGDGSAAGGSSDMTPIIIGAVAVAAIAAVGLVLYRRRSAAAEEE
jgi:peptide/nickel transport system substrate-binding protein